MMTSVETLADLGILEENTSSAAGGSSVSAKVQSTPSRVRLRGNNALGFSTLKEEI